MKTRNHKIQKTNQAVCKQLLLAFVALLLGIFHLINWGSHSFSIITLKAKQILQVANVSDFSKQTEICMSLKKYDCAEASLRSDFNVTKNLEILAQLGDLQQKRQKYKEASLSYNLYFANSGNDHKVAFNYAKVLAKLGQTQDAMKYFDYVLASEDKKDLIQITVFRTYVEFLAQNHQSTKVQEVLSVFKKQAQQASQYVKAEVERLEDKFVKKS